MNRASNNEGGPKEYKKTREQQLLEKQFRFLLMIVEKRHLLYEFDHQQNNLASLPQEFTLSDMKSLFIKRFYQHIPGDVEYSLFKQKAYLFTRGIDWSDVIWKNIADFPGSIRPTSDRMNVVNRFNGFDYIHMPLLMYQVALQAVMFRCSNLGDTQPKFDRNNNNAVFAYLSKQIQTQFKNQKINFQLIQKNEQKVESLEKKRETTR